MHWTGKENLHRGHLHVWEGRASLWASKQHPLLSQAATSLPETGEILHWKLFHLCFYLHGGRLLQNTQLGQPETLTWNKRVVSLCQGLCRTQRGVAAMREAKKGKGWFLSYFVSAAVKGTWSVGICTQGIGNGGGSAIHLRMEHYVVQPTKNLRVKSFSTYAQILRLN